jgi:hypothetical protein
MINSAHTKDMTNLFQLPTGLSTGLSVLDNFFPWRGIPKGEISLFSGAPGTGATSLWLKAAGLINSQAKMAGWICSDLKLNSAPTPNDNTQRIVVLNKTARTRCIFDVLQTMLKSDLFALIGCQLRKLNFKSSQLQELKNLAQKHQVALVFITESKEPLASSLFSLIVDCHHDFFTVQRAVQRPTPFTISASMIFSELMPQLTQTLGAVPC